MADFREVFAKAKHIAIITGAGVSAESGVPTFRGAGGFWRKWQAQVGSGSLCIHAFVHHAGECGGSGIAEGRGWKFSHDSAAGTELSLQLPLQLFPMPLGICFCPSVYQLLGKNNVLEGNSGSFYCPCFPAIQLFAHLLTPSLFSYHVDQRKD